MTDTRPADYWLRYRLHDLKAQITAEDSIGRKIGLYHAAKRMVTHLEEQMNKDDTDLQETAHAGILDKLLETVEEIADYASQSRSAKNNNSFDLPKLLFSLNKLMDALNVQLASIRDLHDTAKTQNSIIVSLQNRVTSLEAKYATNYIHVKDTPISNISVNVPPTVPHKDNTSKLLLKRFLAVQRICEASIDLDKHGAVAPSTDRQWLAQSVLNILNGNVDG
jgi:hypothetical protein